MRGRRKRAFTTDELFALGAVFNVSVTALLQPLSQPQLVPVLPGCHDADWYIYQQRLLGCDNDTRVGSGDETRPFTIEPQACGRRYAMQSPTLGGSVEVEFGFG